MVATHATQTNDRCLLTSNRLTGPRVVIYACTQQHASPHIDLLLTASPPKPSLDWPGHACMPAISFGCARRTECDVVLPSRCHMLCSCIGGHPSPTAQEIFSASAPWTFGLHGPAALASKNAMCSQHRHLHTGPCTLTRHPMHTKTPLNAVRSTVSG